MAALDPEVRADYVERVARQLEAGGVARMAGRIFGHLATAHEPYLSLTEIANQLGVSRAAVSVNTRRLIDTRVIRRVPVPGSRQEHFAVTPDGSEAAIRASIRLARDIASLADEGVALLGKRITPGAQALRSMRDSYTELAVAFEHIVAPAGQADEA